MCSDTHKPPVLPSKIPRKMQQHTYHNITNTHTHKSPFTTKSLSLLSPCHPTVSQPSFICFGALVSISCPISCHLCNDITQAGAQT